MTTWLACLAATMSVCLVVFAQTNLRTATVEGTVRNLKSGEPIADVRVTLATEPGVPGEPLAGPLSSKTATTDANGRFTIPEVYPGRYLVSGMRTLFFRPRRDAGPSVLTVGEGQRLSGIQILLSPTAVITGRVVDGSRQPLRSVRVEALRLEFRDVGRSWVSAAQISTDDRGEYRLFNLAPGTYYVRATQTGQTAVYYPDVHDSENAVPVTVESGAEASAIDIEMRRSPEYSVLLRLESIPTGSTASFTIRRKNRLANEPQLVARPESLPDNTYRLGQLTPGTYEILALAWLLDRASRAGCVALWICVSWRIETYV